MPVCVHDYVEMTHGRRTLEVLQRVRAADPTYPPSDAGSTGSDLRDWLLSEPGLGRWVVVVDREVAGHVQLTPPHDYLIEQLASFGHHPMGDAGYAEIAKLFVDPLVQRRGVGAVLLAAARAASWASGRQPALAVVSTSAAATRMYVHEGMVEIGEFDGIHGINRVMVDPTNLPRRRTPLPRIQVP